MEKENLEQKLKYVRENILDKGYDPDQFMEFLLNKKAESAINFNNWTLQEIIDSANEFIENNKKKIQDKTKNEKIYEKEEVNLVYNKENMPQEYYTNCLLIEDTPISKEKKIEIKILESKVEKGGIFSFSYSSYLIKTLPINLEVRRRFNDFIWLFNILKGQFPNCIVPPFFKKDSLDKIKIEKRIYYIEIFLNSILMHPLLRNSKIFYDFISIEEEKEFIKAKNKYDKLSVSSEVKQIKSLNGEINISISYDNEKYFENIKEKLRIQDNIFDKLLYNYKSLLNNIHQTSEKMKEISKNWKELYNMKNEYFESDCTLGIYLSLIKVMEEWSNLQTNSFSYLKKNIIEFLNFIKKEFNSFKDLAYIVESNKNIYYKKNEKLLYLKEQIFSEKDKENFSESSKKKEIEISKLVIKDTEKVLELKKDYGCYLNCYIGEYERIRDLNSTRIKENLVNFIKGLNLQMSNYNFSLGEILSFIDSLTEEGYIGNSNINNEIYNNAVPVAGNK